ncbi:hypothetical protein Tco_0787318 [Tanacetum coccineum]
MDAAAMKHMASNFVKLDKFEGVDFKRWQKKIHILLSSMSVVYVMTTPIPEDGGDDATVEQIRKKTIGFLDIYQIRKRRLFNLQRFTQHKMNMDEAIQVSCIIDKLPSFWKDFKHTLKHNKEELTLVELGSHLCIEESLRAQGSDKPKGNNIAGPQAVVRLPDPKLKTLGERGIECIFVRYVEHSKAFRIDVIEPNDSVSINSIIESRDDIFDENRFSLVPRLSLKISNGTEDIGGLVVPEEVTEEVVQQPELELRKSKRNRTPKDFGPEFLLYLVEGTRTLTNTPIALMLRMTPKHLVANLLVANGSLMRSSLDFNKKFYNSLGRAPNRYSSSIGKSQGVVIVHSRNRLGSLDHGLKEF